MSEPGPPDAVPAVPPGPAVPSISTVPTGPRAEQRWQGRRSQVRLIGGLLAALLLVAVAFAVYLAVDAPPPPAPASSGEPTTRTQRTLLLQVLGPNGSGASNALLAHDPAAGDGSVVLVPPQVLITVPGAGSLPLGRALATVQPENCRDGLSDLLGVVVDEGWTITQPVLATLVDRLGGLTAYVDVQVVRGQSVLLEPGTQSLTGERAVAFASHLAPGEPEQARLARLQEVLDGIVEALPDSDSEVAAVLGGLGGRSIPTAPVPELARFLTGLAAADEADRVRYDLLPVVDLDAGGATPVYRADPEPVRELVDRLLPTSVPPGAREGGNRVLVLNGVGTPGLGEAVRTRLVDAGFVFAGSDNAPSFGYRTTQVLVPAATAEGQALGERVTAALGLSGATIGTQDIGTTADVIVVVGADFQP